MKTIRTVCAHDCPDQCSLLAQVDGDRVVKIQGDPEHPFTAGFACAKVNREHEMLVSPDRILTPLRRTGAKGEGRFAPITWEQALDEIVTRWQAIIEDEGPLGILGYCYSAHQGQINRGLMQVLARDGLANSDYLARKTLGFDKVEREVLPRFSPERVAAITGVSATDLVRLAHLYGKARAPFIRLGEGMSRSHQGGQAIRTVALLPGVVGAYDKPGGGALLMTAPTFGFDASPIRKPSGPAQTRTVNHSRLGEALLTMKDPPLRALFVAGNNPAVTCPDSAAVRRGLAREDLFTVVHDPLLSDTARYADIVLPAASYLESEDVLRGYGTYYVQFAQEVAPPPGEAWPNRRLAQELARRLGLKDAVFSMSALALAKLFFADAAGTASGLDPEAVRRNGPVKVAPSGPQRFATPSGKLEFYSETLAAQGLPALPDWAPDAHGESLERRFPLRLLTAPGYFQSHTAFSGIAALRKKQGAPACVLHPEEAKKRGLEDGQTVELHNDVGVVRLVLRVSDEAPPGVAFVPGQRPAAEGGGTTVNMLCSDRYSDMGDGATYQDTRLDVRRAPAAR